MSVLDTGSRYSISPQVAAQVTLGQRQVSSADLTERDRRLLSRMETCGAHDLESLEQYASNYMSLFVPQTI